jgi:hypothetical protein
VEKGTVANFGGMEYNPARDPLLLLELSGESPALDTVLRLPGRGAVTWVDYVDGQPVATRQMPVPFAARALGAGAGDRLAVVPVGETALTLFGVDGELKRIVCRPSLVPPKRSLLRTGRLPSTR